MSGRANTHSGCREWNPVTNSRGRDSVAPESPERSPIRIEEAMPAIPPIIELQVDRGKL
jgi:hypothetical protein